MTFSIVTLLIFTSPTRLNVDRLPALFLKFLQSPRSCYSFHHSVGALLCRKITDLGLIRDVNVECGMRAELRPTISLVSLLWRGASKCTVIGFCVLKIDCCEE